MTATISYSKRGGAQMGFVNAPWPLGKIEISNSSVTISILGKRHTLSADEAVRVEPLSVFTNDWSAGVRLFYRGEHWEETLDFRCSKSTGREVLEVLRRAGFNIVEPDKQI